MAKRNFLRKDETPIMTFRNLEILDSEKKRNANFYITNKRVVLRSVNDKKGMLFGEITLDEIDRVLQKVSIKVRVSYLMVSLLFGLFSYLSIFHEVGSIINLLFVGIFIFSFSGLFSHAKHNLLFFALSLGMVALNILILTSSAASLAIYIVDAVFALMGLTVGLKPDRFAKLSVFITISSFVTYNDLKQMLKSGLVQETNDSYIDRLLDGVTREDKREERREKRNEYDKKHVKIIKSNLHKGVFKDAVIDGAYSPDAPLMEPRKQINRTVIRSRVDLRYIYKKNCKPLFISLEKVIERNNAHKKEEEERRRGIIAGRYQREHRVFEEALQNVKETASIHDNIYGVRKGREGFFAWVRRVRAERKASNNK
ncbi:MAG: hypothetical protein LBT20_00940 [Clostridiales bacterium]|jgi:hypothetical protein|nr:hypothetical protein [Clostridiales bacterium]